MQGRVSELMKREVRWGRAVKRWQVQGITVPGGSKMVGTGEWQDEQRRRMWKMKSGLCDADGGGARVRPWRECPSQHEGHSPWRRGGQGPEAKAVGRILTVTEGTKSEGRTQHREADRGRR